VIGQGSSNLSLISWAPTPLCCWDSLHCWCTSYHYLSPSLPHNLLFSLLLLSLSLSFFKYTSISVSSSLSHTFSLSITHALYLVLSPTLPYLSCSHSLPPPSLSLSIFLFPPLSWLISLSHTLSLSSPLS